MNGTVIKRHRRRSERNSRQGAAMTEFALMLPLIFLFLAGVIEFGTLFYVRQTCLQAAREGARIRALEGTTSQDAIDVAQRHVDAVYPALNFTITVSGDFDTDATCTVSIPIADASYMQSSFLPTGDVSGTVVMRKEGL